MYSISRLIALMFVFSSTALFSSEQMIVVYKGAGTADLFTAYFDGEEWSGDKRISSQPGGISPQSDKQPAAVMFRNRLYIVYKGAHYDDLYTASYDGKEWSGNTRIRDQPGGIWPQSKEAPGVAVINDRLVIVYRGANYPNLYTASFDGSEWSGNQTISRQPGNISPMSELTPAVGVLKIGR